MTILKLRVSSKVFNLMHKKRLEYITTNERGLNIWVRDVRFTQFCELYKITEGFTIINSKDL